MRAALVGQAVPLREGSNYQTPHEEQKCPRPAPRQERPLQVSAMNGYHGSRGGTKFSLTVRALVHRIKLSRLPALSLVPLARPPPKGCWPTTAPVGLSFL